MGPDSRVRFSAANRPTRPPSICAAFAAHLVFGLVVAAVTEAAWVLSGRPDLASQPTTFE